MKLIGNDTLTILGLITLISMPAFVIVLSKKLNYLWWFIWCLFVVFGVYLISKRFVPSADPYASLVHQLDRTVGLIIISASVVSFILHIAQSRIQTLIPSKTRRYIFNFIAAIILFLAIVVPASLVFGK